MWTQHLLAGHWLFARHAPGESAFRLTYRGTTIDTGSMKCVAGGRQDGHLLHSKAGTRTHLASAKVTCQTLVCACWPVSRWPLSFGRCSPGIAWPGDQDQGSDVLAKVAMPCEYPPRTTYCSSGMSKHASLVSCTALFRPPFLLPLLLPLLGLLRELVLLLLQAPARRYFVDDGHYCKLECRAIAAARPESVRIPQ